MDSLLRSLNREPGLVVFALLIIVVLLTALSVYQWMQLGRFRNDWQQMFGSNTSGELMNLLKEHQTERKIAMETLNQVQNRLDDVTSKVSSSKRYCGVVRYDAFSDVGGMQSFALALYDETGHGIVFSTIVGRSDSRVYCKEIVAGKADTDLSAEETEAIKLAAKNRAALLAEE